jgi:L-iditol 2-dehydrogenase
LKVSLWYNNKDIRIEEVQTPKPGPKEMLVKVMSCGICGSDIVEWYRLPRAPLVQGHELGAEVVEVGAAVTQFKIGDRVFVAPKVPCMECSYCRNGNYPQCTEVKERLPGGFAEYVLVPEILIRNGTLLLPDNMTYDQSTFIEPLACVVRAQNVAKLKQAQSILVLGCGMSGLLHVILAKSRRATVIATDINSKRLEFAREIGADLTINAADNIAERLLAETGKLADVVMLCTSAMAAVEQAFKCVDRGGAIVFFTVPGPETSITPPINDFWTKGISILTSYFCGPPDQAESLELIASSKIKVDDMITHRLSLQDIEAGFQLVTDGQESIKVIIRPHQDST